MLVRSAPRHLQWLAILLAVAVSPVARVQADESVLESSAARFLPANGAFYVSFQQNRRQVEAFLNSNAFQHLKSIPFVEQMMKEAGDGGPLQQFKMLQQNPQAAPILQLVLDGLSHEIFIYGGEEYGEIASFLQDFSMSLNTANIQAALSGGNPQRAQLQALLKGIQQLPAGVELPPTIIGFRVSNPGPLKQMLAQLEQTAALMAQQQPQLEGKVHRKTIGNGDYVYVDLDGTMIPWEQIRNEFPGSDEDFNKLKGRLEKMTLSVAVGIYENCLLFYTGGNVDHLSQLGSEQTLAKRKEFAKLKPVDNKPVTTITFVNGDYVAKAASPQKQATQLVQMARSVLASAPIGDDLRKEITADIEKFSKKLESSLPEPGSVFGYCYLDGSGYSHATFNWGATNLDGSKALDVLNHVGGNPIAFFAFRPEYDPADYDTLAAFVDRLVYYGDRIADVYLEGKQKELYIDLRDAMLPLLQRLDKANRDYLLPAYAGVDGAIVIDAKTKSKSWQAFLPPSDEPLPMIEFGIVDRINDAEKVRKGCAEYFAVAQEVLDKLHELSTGKYADLFDSPIPKITIPQPQSREIAGGTVYYYSLPPQAGIDSQIAPNAGLNDKVAVVSLIPKFTARLMQNTSLSGDLAEFQDKPAGAAYYFNFAGLVDSLMPWVDYAAVFMGQVNVSTNGANAQPGDVISQIKDVAKFLQCFKSCRGITTHEDDVWVTRGKILIQDLPN